MIWMVRQGAQSSIGALGNASIPSEPSSVLGFGLLGSAGVRLGGGSGLRSWSSVS